MRLVSRNPTPAVPVRQVAEPPGVSPPQYIVQWSPAGASLRPVSYTAAGGVDRGTAPQNLVKAGRT